MTTAEHQAVNTALRAFTRGNFNVFYNTFTPKSYVRTWWRDLCGDTVQDFLVSKKRYLFVNIPTQHGKSEMFSQRLIAWVLGRKPDTRVLGVSCSSSLLSRNCAATYNLMRTKEYAKVFPIVSVGNEKEGMKEAKRQTYFQINGRKGYYYTATAAGQVTGWAADLILYDDPYQSQTELGSQAVRDKVQSNFDAAVRTRMREDTKVVMVASRMGGNDLQNYILTKLVEAGENIHDVCEFLVLPFFKGDEPVRELVTIGENEVWIDTGAKSFGLDPRVTGEPLDISANIAEAEAMKVTNPTVYYALYDQNPSKAGGGTGDWFHTFDNNMAVDTLKPVGGSYRLSFDFNVRGFTCIVAQGSPYNKTNKSNPNHFCNVLATFQVPVEGGGLRKVCEMVKAKFAGFYEVTGDNSGYNRFEVPVEINGKMCANGYEVIQAVLGTCKVVAPRDKLGYADSYALCARFFHAIRVSIVRPTNTLLINDLNTAKVRQGTKFDLLKDSNQNKQDAGDAMRYYIHTYYF